MANILSLAAIKLIESKIDELFDRAASRYLGPAALPKFIAAGFKNEYSLPAIFMAAAREEGAVPDKAVIDHLVRNAKNYLDAYRAEAKAQVINKVQSFLNEAATKGIKTNVEKVLGGALADTWKTTTTNVKRLIETEATSARNLGTLEGILAVNASEGVEDPVVYFVTVRDQYLCDECKRLHLLDDEKTPRLWYLSELGHGYHKRGQPQPKVGGLHPNCRCTMVTLMTGYGFDSSGTIKFISQDHDEMAEQRGLDKSEREYAPHDCDQCRLAKSTPDGIKTYQKLRKRYFDNGKERIERWQKWREDRARVTNTPIEKLPHEKGFEPHPKFVEAIRKAPIAMNMPTKRLPDLLKTGRFKNLFETGTGMGETDQMTRSREEERALGIPRETPSTERPVYGALHILHGDPVVDHYGPAPSYGGTWVVLHPHVKERSSFTPRDSFATHFDEVYTHDHPEALGHAAAGWGGDYPEEVHQYLLGKHDPDEAIPAPSRYLEAQVHGGVDIAKDVAEIHIPVESNGFSPETQKAAQELVDRHGVRVFMHHHKAGCRHWQCPANHHSVIELQRSPPKLEEPPRKPEQMNLL